VSTSATTLIQRVRRYVGDWPDLDVTTASLSNSVTTATVADTSIYGVNWLIQLDQEVLRVKTAPSSGTSLTVARGMQGTTAASHANSTSVLLRPAYTDQQILDSLNAGIDATFPYFYQPVQDTSLLPNGTTYEFTVPNLTSPSQPIPFITRIDLKVTGDTAYRQIDGRWEIRRGSTPVIKFRSPPAPGTLRVYGFGPFAQLAFTDTLPSLWPSWGEDPLVEFAAQRLLMNSEAARTRHDVGPRDDREAAQRQGGAAATAGQILQRFQMTMAARPMPPMPRHVQRTFF
jgi:hypothetical protein